MASDCQDENRIDLRDVSIERDISMRSAADDQFTPTGVRQTPYERVVYENVDRLNDFLDPLIRIFHLERHQVIKDA